MTVQVFSPQISVILRKNIGRATVAGTIAASQRFQGTARTLDLTPYLGDTGGVTVSKNVREPMGSWSVTLADDLAPGQLESLYGVIEPMDVVEIRMARDVSKYAAAIEKHMPIIMRGFVENVSRSQQMTDSGPRRTVTITGGDYGLILNIIRYALYPGYVPEATLLSAFQFFTTYGLGADATRTPAQFVESINDKVITPFLKNMQASGAGSSSPVLTLTAQALVQGGFLSPIGLNQWPGGTIYSCLAHFGDVGPWNELFVQDFEVGPYLIYRPVPFKSVAGEFINAPFTEGIASNGDGIPIIPPTRIVTDAEVIDLDVRRSAANVANYYWVDNGYTQTIGAPIMQSVLIDKGNASSILDYPNSSAALYGFRLMKVDTEQYPRIDGQIESVFRQGTQSLIDFIGEKRAQLIAQNQDNVVLENGEMRLRGREDIHAGEYVNLMLGVNGGTTPGFSQKVYADSVTHEFLPYRSFTTTVQFDRGTGFIERAQREGGADSPYFAEMSPGRRLPMTIKGRN